MNNTWYVPHVIPFPTINSKSDSVIKSNFTFVFSMGYCHANIGAVRKQAGLVHLLLGKYSESSPISLQYISLQ